MDSLQRMHTDEISTNVTLVAQLITEQFPQWIDLPIRPVRSAGTDNAMCRLGEDMVDLPVAWNLLPVSARNIFRAALGVDEATWARGHGWALAIALVQLPYYQHTNPVLAASARHVICEVLADYQRDA